MSDWTQIAPEYREIYKVDDVQCFSCHTRLPRAVPIFLFWTEMLKRPFCAECGERYIRSEISVLESLIDSVKNYTPPERQ